MSTLAGRIAAALGSGSFGQVVNVGIQLASLPLFLRHWDLATYGTWLMLTALPAYLSMADAGMTAAAGNRMTMAMAQGHTAQASTVFHSATVFTLLACLAVAALATPLVLAGVVPGLHTPAQQWAVLALTGGVLLTLLGGLADALFRATQRYALGDTLATLTRLGEWLGWLVGLWAWGSLVAVAACGLVARAAGLALCVALSARQARGLHWGVSGARLHELRTMVHPALSFMLFPLAQALGFQGITLLVGHLFGPVVVALFTTYRTLARVAVQVTATFSHALWVEFSRLFGEGGGAAVRALYRRGSWWGGAMAVGLSVAVYLASPWVLLWWTHGRIAHQPALMAMLLAYAAVCGLWHVPRVLLMATNQHMGLAVWTLLASAGALGLAWAFSGPWGLPGVGLAMLMGEAMLAVLCLKQAAQLVKVGPA